VPQYRFGDIVEAAIPDPNGHNPKPRPVLIVTRDEDIAVNEDVLVVAISSTGLDGALPSDFFILPWASDGRCRTGLRRRCAAKCNWRQLVPKVAILRHYGSAPGKILKEIADFLADLAEDANLAEE